jgi:sulfate transport system substrate-binding protein
LAINELGRDKFEIVYPSVSILAEPPVTIIDKNVDRRGTRAVAEEYLKYLYSADGQRLAAKHYYRPVNPESADPADLKRFVALSLFSIDQVFGGWQKAQREHFSDGGIFDQIYQPRK